VRQTVATLAATKAGWTVGQTVANLASMMAVRKVASLETRSAAPSARLMVERKAKNWAAGLVAWWAEQ
jgi:hypothetical protein